MGFKWYFHRLSELKVQITLKLSGANMAAISVVWDFVMAWNPKGRILLQVSFEIPKILGETGPYTQVLFKPLFNRHLKWTFCEHAATCLAKELAGDTNPRVSGKYGKKNSGNVLVDGNKDWTRQGKQIPSSQRFGQCLKRWEQWYREESKLIRGDSQQEHYWHKNKA